MSRAGGGRLRTFAIAFEEPGFSEATAAEESARHFGTDHTTTPLTGTDVARDLDRLLAAMDQPTGDGVNTYYVSQAARAGGVTVALSGLGGDELFGGYPAFRATPRLARLLRGWRCVPSPLRRAAISRLGRGDIRQRKLADVLAHARTLHEVAALQRRVFSQPAIELLLSPEARAAVRAIDPFHPALETLAADVDPGRPFSLVSAWEMRTYMADVLLRDSDVMSMRHSLELRVPLVDRPLVEWLWRQPDTFKQDSRRPKAVLHEALRDVLPPGLAQRRKWGFTLPMAIWMKRELRTFLDDTFAEASLRRCGLFDPAAVQTAWETFLRSDDTREWSRLWSLAVLVAFANRPRPSSS
jgi:asparagine synthase (glutamine-hydrolysing)